MRLGTVFDLCPYIKERGSLIRICNSYTYYCERSKKIFFCLLRNFGNDLEKYFVQSWS